MDPSAEVFEVTERVVVAPSAGRVALPPATSRAEEGEFVLSGESVATVRVGSGANVTSDAYPGRVFRGRVSYVDPKIDPATRTAQVRIELANPAQIFKIGMYVNVAFGAQGIAITTPVVPKDAVQAIVNQQFVFVATEKPNEFALRPIRLGPESNGVYPVLEGLSVGERVVVEGSFLLRAEWLKQHPQGPQ